MSEASQTLYRSLPQLGDLLADEPLQQLAARYGRERVGEAARGELAGLRTEIKAGRHTQESLLEAVEDLPGRVAVQLKERLRPSLRPVINATGVILQTNLGRAPLAAEALAEIQAVASGYCNLEFDLEAGERSKRDVHAEGLLLQILGAAGGSAAQGAAPQAAAVVNNCAAATFLALNSLAEGGEVIVSRGELVEIGGGFRIPEILQKSGALLREVGTTNRTRASDYAAVLSPATRLILRVHRANFRIEGFTEQPDMRELLELSKRAQVPVFEDQGTGSLLHLEEFGVHGESSLRASVHGGIPLIAASGDKLLGGPQCGLLVGEAALLERIRANPLFRALRVDKLTYAALGATLRAYLQGRTETLPAIAMVRLPAETIRPRCENLAAAVRSPALLADVVSVESVIGGGTTPGATLPSFAVALQHGEISAQRLAAALRALPTPVVARTQGGRVLLDLRTVFPAQDATLGRLLLQASEQGAAGDGAGPPA